MGHPWPWALVSAIRIAQGERPPARPRQKQGVTDATGAACPRRPITPALPAKPGQAAGSLIEGGLPRCAALSLMSSASRSAVKLALSHAVLSTYLGLRCAFPASSYHVCK